MRTRHLERKTNPTLRESRGMLTHYEIKLKHTQPIFHLTQVRQLNEVDGATYHNAEFTIVTL